MRTNGERASVPANVHELMAPIIEEIKDMNLHPSKIYNWDETGLFYRALPKCTLAVKDVDDGAGVTFSLTLL